MQFTGADGLFFFKLGVLITAVGHDNAAVGLGASGVRRHIGIILKRGMDNVALIGVHRLEGDVPAVLGDLAGDLLCKPLERFLALEAVVLRVDVDAHALVLAAVDLPGSFLNHHE